MIKYILSIPSKPEVNWLDLNVHVIHVPNVSKYDIYTHTHIYIYIFTGFSSAPSQPPAPRSQRPCAQLQWCSSPWEAQLIEKTKFVHGDEDQCDTWPSEQHAAHGSPQSALATRRQLIQMWKLPRNETGMQLAYWIGLEPHFLQLITAWESKVQAA